MGSRRKQKLTVREEAIDMEYMDMLVMEKILAKRVRNGRSEYLVKWESFTKIIENTWEPKETLGSWASWADRFDEEQEQKRNQRKRSGAGAAEVNGSMEEMEEVEIKRSLTWRNVPGKPPVLQSQVTEGHSSTKNEGVKPLMEKESKGNLTEKNDPGNTGKPVPQVSEGYGTTKNERVKTLIGVESKDSLTRKNDPKKPVTQISQVDNSTENEEIEPLMEDLEEEEEMKGNFTWRNDPANPVSQAYPSTKNEGDPSLVDWCPKPRSGFTRGLRPLKVVAIGKPFGLLFLLIQWEGEAEIEPIPAYVANTLCPQLVIDFYRKHLIFNDKVSPSSA